MANTVQFDLVSPERRLASVAATEVQIPGADGDMTAMAGHASTITTLRPGVLRVVGTDGTKAYAVTGGFAEITPTAISVLAENAVPLSELTPAMVDAMVASAREQASAALPADRAAAEKLVNDFLSLKSVGTH